VQFEVVGEIVDPELIASGRRVRQRRRLVKTYGGRRWRKFKGVAMVRLSDGTIRRAELHWYEAHGVGRRELKLKRLLANS
jgi:hypothetical protein